MRRRGGRLPLSPRPLSPRRRLGARGVKKATRYVRVRSVDQFHGVAHSADREESIRIALTVAPEPKTGVPLLTVEIEALRDGRWRNASDHALEGPEQLIDNGLAIERVAIALDAAIPEWYRANGIHV